jgi:hypothetical protein
MLKLIASYLQGRFQRTRLQSKYYNLNICSDWGNVSHGVPQGSILGPLLFLIYINDLPLALNKFSTPILFTDDTSVIISESDPFIFRNKLNEVFKILNTWFNNNLLSLHFSKTEYIIFAAKRIYEQDDHIKIAYGNKVITDSCHTKFLGINITKTLSWKKHIDQLIPKLNAACYAIRTVRPFVKLETLLMVYYAYFHSIMHYGNMFWGNSSYAINVFQVQKRALRIMMGIGSRDSCRQLFITLGILPLQSQYIYSLLSYMVNNMDSYQFISDTHNRNTRQGCNFNPHQPLAHRSLYLKGAYYMGIRVFNNLPVLIKQLYNNPIDFKLAVKVFLGNHSFYTLDEYFDCRFDKNNDIIHL